MDDENTTDDSTQDPRIGAPGPTLVEPEVLDALALAPAKSFDEVGTENSTENINSENRPASDKTMAMAPDANSGDGDNAPISPSAGSSGDIESATNNNEENGVATAPDAATGTPPESTETSQVDTGEGNSQNEGDRSAMAPDANNDGKSDTLSPEGVEQGTAPSAGLDSKADTVTVENEASPPSDSNDVESQSNDEENATGDTNENGLETEATALAPEGSAPSTSGAPGDETENLKSTLNGETEPATNGNAPTTSEEPQPAPGTAEAPAVSPSAGGTDTENNKQNDNTPSTYPVTDTGIEGYCYCPCAAQAAVNREQANKMAKSAESEVSVLPFVSRRMMGKENKKKSFRRAKMF
ncbi:hypothetical protein BSKO_06057 [Bryopsis sp. KO-2023]|nr:hypothetical protein BSKO_06057 [Bryopsis sp. KO-2023]